MELAVSEPILKKEVLGDYHEYPIVGLDSNGKIECTRRFNLFFEFREALMIRYAGLYIPPLPSKKLSGKGETTTLIERQHFLDLFLKECCALKYLVQSIELQTFLRPTGNLKQELSRLQSKNKTADKIAILRATIEVNEVSIF